MTALEVTSSEYYRSWTAYDSLKKAAEETSFLSVWKLLFNFPKKGDDRTYFEPQCWKTQPLFEIPPELKARIQWYYDVDVPNAGKSRENREEEDDACFKGLQAYFVGHHQCVELILLFLKPCLDRLYELIKPERYGQDDLPQDVVQGIVRECTHISNGWLLVSELIRAAGQLDRIRYLHYIPRLLGVSGGNSPLMMSLTARTASLEERSMLSKFTVEDLAKEMEQESSLGKVAEGFIDCLDALSRCWFEHVVTATTSIGLTLGTKGTPNIILVDRVLRRLHKSRLLLALGSLRKCTTDQAATQKIGIEMRQLHDYASYPLAEHYLDLFVDPGAHFATHSYGWLPKEYELACSDFIRIRRKQRANLFGYFYTETRPAFCQALCSKMLGLTQDQQAEVGIGLGSSVTEVLSRILASLPGSKDQELSVLMPDDEFLTIQRSVAILKLSEASVVRVKAQDFVDRALNHHSGLIAFSLMNSCTQQVVDSEWIKDASPEVVIVVDITQAVGNLPLRLGWMARMPNVFIIGSLVKHPRCGEGLGFMTFAHANSAAISDPASGWIANLSGLQNNRTCENGKLLYDDCDLKWEGGTPSFVEATYVATRILELMPPVEAQHDYVKKLQAQFLERAEHLLSAKQHESVSESNTLAIPVSQKVDLPYGLDYKIIEGTTYLRIGFGIHCLSYHLDALLHVLESTDALQDE